MKNNPILKRLEAFKVYDDVRSVFLLRSILKRAEESGELADFELQVNTEPSKKQKDYARLIKQPIRFQPHVNVVIQIGNKKRSITKPILGESRKRRKFNARS